MLTCDRGEHLITVDYYSSYIEIDKLTSTTSSAVIHKLKSHFARYGIPTVVMSDNGPQFSSKEFSKFSKKWDFQHVTSSPLHPQSNGKAESAVKIAKGLLRKAKQAGTDEYLALLDIRNTPTQGMGSSPVQRFMSRRTRTLLPTTTSLMKPKSETHRMKLKSKQTKMKQLYDKTARDMKPLCIGDTVRIQPKKLGDRLWEKATVRRSLGNRSYEVKTREATYRRNRVQLRKTREPPEVELEDFFPNNAAPEPDVIHEPEIIQEPDVIDEPEIGRDPVAKMRSPRQRRRPGYLRDYVQ